MIDYGLVQKSRIAEQRWRLGRSGMLQSECVDLMLSHGKGVKLTAKTSSANGRDAVVQKKV